MKEIELRAWHKQEQKMYPVRGTLYQLIYLRKDEQNAALETLSGVHEHNVELMQYTGLKDCKGTKGYKDDLVKMFDRSLFRIAWDDYYARFQLELVKGKEFTKVHNMGMLQFGEIIGNIYEHPELLEETRNA
jgi:uncharacterized phage protein (TIGR01671 family)